MNKIIVFLFAFFLVLPLGNMTWAKDTYEFENVARIVAIGDLHGDFAGYVEIMEMAGLRDREGHWIGGKSHLVQTGDITDRGPDSRQIIDDLRKLKKRAKKAGGRIHTLIGNHELMNIVGDLRYVHPGEFEAFRGNASKVRLDDYYRRSEVAARTQAEEAGEEFSQSAFRQEWYETHPLGFIEHRLNWGSGGPYFKWAIKNPALVKINDSLFVHAGISATYAHFSLKGFNKQVRNLINKKDEQALDLLFSENGQLWYRGQSENEGEEEETNLATVLENYKAERLVIGHTPTGGYILPRFEGRVVVIDVGLGEFYGSNRGFLLFEEGLWFGVHWGSKTPFPVEFTKQTLVDYLSQVAAVSPDPHWIEKQILDIKSEPTP